MIRQRLVKYVQDYLIGNSPLLDLSVALSEVLFADRAQEPQETVDLAHALEHALGEFSGGYIDLAQLEDRLREAAGLGASINCPGA